MRTIKIEFTLSEREWEHLCRGKCEKPNPQRIKMMLLQESAKNQRWLIDQIMQEARGEKPKGIKWYDMTPNQRATEDKRLAERRARDRKRAFEIDRLTAAEIEAKAIALAKPRPTMKWRNLPTKQEMAAKRAAELKLLKAKVKAKTKSLNHSDRSAQPKFDNGGRDIEWLTDDNIAKLKS